LRELQRLLIEHFDQEEMKVFAFDLAVDWADLAGETKKIKAQSLISHLARRGQLEDLAMLLREERPNISLPTIANRR